MHALATTTPHPPSLTFPVSVRQPLHYARRHPGVCISPSHTTLACPRCTFLLCNMARHWGDQGRVRQATRASEHTGEANPILVTRMGVALTAACCVTIDAKASPNRRCTALSFACSCGGYQTCSKPSGKEREREERGYGAPQTQRHNKPASPTRLRPPTPVFSFRFANSPALEAVIQPSLRVALTLPLFPCSHPFLALSLVQKHTQLTSAQSQ